MEKNMRNSLPDFTPSIKFLVKAAAATMRGQFSNLKMYKKMFTSLSTIWRHL
jgi:hypothetical protein